MNKTVCIHGSLSFYETPLIELLLKEEFKVIWINSFKQFDSTRFKNNNLLYIDVISRDFSCLLGLGGRIPPEFSQVEILINTECAGSHECHDTWDIGENLVRNLNVTESIIPLMKNSKSEAKVININFTKDNHHINDVISNPIVHTLIDAFRNGIKRENILLKEFSFEVGNLQSFFLEKINLNNIRNLALS